jgi:hypothetical protein
VVGEPPGPQREVADLGGDRGHADAPEGARGHDVPLAGDFAPCFPGPGHVPGGGAQLGADQGLDAELAGAFGQGAQDELAGVAGDGGG